MTQLRQSQPFSPREAVANLQRITWPGQRVREPAGRAPSPAALPPRTPEETRTPTSSERTRPKKSPMPARFLHVCRLVPAHARWQWASDEPAGRDGLRHPVDHRPHGGPARAHQSPAGARLPRSGSPAQHEDTGRGAEGSTAVVCARIRHRTLFVRLEIAKHANSGHHGPARSTAPLNASPTPQSGISPVNCRTRQHGHLMQTSFLKKAAISGANPGCGDRKPAATISASRCTSHRTSLHEAQWSKNP